MTKDDWRFYEKIAKITLQIDDLEEKIKKKQDKILKLRKKRDERIKTTFGLH